MLVNEVNCKPNIATFKPGKLSKKYSFPLFYSMFIPTFFIIGFVIFTKPNIYIYIILLTCNDAMPWQRDIGEIRMQSYRV